MSFQIYYIEKPVSANTFIVCTKKETKILAGNLHVCLFLTGKEIYES